MIDKNSMRIYIYIIYTSNLGLMIAVFDLGREQGRFRGSSEGARRSTKGARRSTKGAGEARRKQGEHRESKQKHEESRRSTKKARGRSTWGAALKSLN